MAESKLMFVLYWGTGRHPNSNANDKVMKQTTVTHVHYFCLWLCKKNTIENIQRLITKCNYRLVRLAMEFNLVLIMSGKYVP